MDIAEIRKIAAEALRANSTEFSKEVREEAEFVVSPLKDFFDRRIKEAAAEGRWEVSLNFYDVKECIFGYKFVGPKIDAVIRHYQNGGFAAWRKSWVCANTGEWETAIVISWK